MVSVGACEISRRSERKSKSRPTLVKLSTYITLHIVVRRFIKNISTIIAELYSHGNPDVASGSREGLLKEVCMSMSRDS